MEQEVPATEPGEETCEAAPLVVDCTALTNETLREAVKRWSSDEQRDTNCRPWRPGTRAG